MTEYEEAIEKMARALHALDAEGHTGNGPAPTFEECSRWYLESASAAAVAIGLREMMQALTEIRDANPIDMALDPQWPSRIAARALTEARAG